eukprot:2670820-Amphidinium_carterae.1
MSGSKSSLSESTVDMSVSCVQLPLSKKRRGGGGLWRAWVRYKSFGIDSKPNFKALAVEYREAKLCNDPVLTQLTQIASAATLAAQQKRGRKSAFGFSSKCKRRMQRRHVMIARWKRSVKHKTKPSLWRAQEL